jgi:hypothetical protein
MRLYSSYGLLGDSEKQVGRPHLILAKTMNCYKGCIFYKKNFVESPACGVGSMGPIVLGVGGVEQVLRPRPGDFHLGFGVDIVHHYLVGHRGALDNSAPKMPHQDVSYPPVSIIGKQEKFTFEDYSHNLLDK